MQLLHRRQALGGGIATATAILAASRTRAQTPLVLDFPSWQAEEPGNREWWRLVIDTFQAAHPGVRVNLYQIPFAQFVNQMTTRFAGNNPPDVVHLPTRNFASFASEDWLAPLGDVLASTDVPRTWNALQSEMVWDGKPYGLLLMVYGSMLFCNRRILGDAIPTTPDGWLADIERTTNRNAGVFGIVATTNEHPNLVVETGTWVMGRP